MQFQCPHCEGIVAIDDNECGQPAACGHCGGISIVPESRFSQSAVINDFIIKETLGRGGMGKVYLAHQQTLDRPVALKILMEEFSEDGDFILDFVKEARAAARLNHPNIVQAYAVGEEDGIFFFAMEYVEGQTLKQLMQAEGEIELDRAIGIMQQIAEALDFAWKNQQLVHRDIKPDNIMLTTKGSAKLADLGLARKANELAEADDDEVMGTPQYISPEQLLGKPMDVRGDIYSLGATFFHCVTGKFPFEGSSPAEIARKHLQEPVRSPAEVREDVPESICYIIMKMMEKRPEERYKDAAALADDLRRVLHNESPAGFKEPKSAKGTRSGKRGASGKFKATNTGKQGRTGKQPAIKKNRTRSQSAVVPAVEAEPPPPEPVEAPAPKPGQTTMAKGGKKKIKVGKKRKGRTMSTTSATAAATSMESTGTMAPATTATTTAATTVATGPQTTVATSSGGSGKTALVLVAVGLVLFVGCVAAFALYMKKYSPDSREAALELYLNHATVERADFNILKASIELPAADREALTHDEIKAIVADCQTYLQKYPKSLLSQMRDDNIAEKYGVHSFFEKNIRPMAKPLIGMVLKAYRDFDELDVVRRRAIVRAKEQKEIDARLAEKRKQDQINAAEDMITQQLEAVKRRIAAADKKYANHLVQCIGLYTAEQSETRERVVENGRTYDFKATIDMLRQTEENTAHYPEQLKKVMADYIKAVGDTRDLLRQASGKFGVPEDELAAKHRDAVNNVNVAGAMRALEQRLALENAFYETRSTWLQSWVNSVKLAEEYFQLLAGTQQKLKGKKIRHRAIKTTGLSKKLISNVTRTDVLVTVLEYGEQAQDYRPVKTVRVPIKELRLDEIRRLAEESWVMDNGDDAVEGLSLRTGSFLAVIGKRKDARLSLLEAIPEEATFLLNELTHQALTRAMQMLQEIDDVEKRSAFVDKLREKYDTFDAFKHFEPALQKFVE